jgi:hypothetical protein
VIAYIILLAVLLALVACFVAFYRHSKTPEWGDSEARKSALRFLMVIAPLWGMRYQEPHHELPVVTTPGDDHAPLPTVSGGAAPPATPPVDAG